MLRKWMLALCFCLGIFGCGCSETTSNNLTRPVRKRSLQLHNLRMKKQLGICLQWILTSH